MDLVHLLSACRKVGELLLESGNLLLQLCGVSSVGLELGVELLELCGGILLLGSGLGNLLVAPRLELSCCSLLLLKLLNHVADHALDLSEHIRTVVQAHGGVDAGGELREGWGIVL